MIGLLAFFEEEAEIDVSAHLDQVTELSLWAIALLLGFFLVRPELWRRLFLEKIDPRPAALMRIAFGAVVLWTFLDLTMWARFLFTDEGLWLTDMARNNYGDKLKTLWDPEHGFERWSDALKAMWGKFTLLHFRSDPPFVYTLYAAMILSCTLMILGVWTRVTTIITWFLVENLYRYSPVFYTGGDTVVRVFMFMGMFAAWGEAYSVDSLRRRRKAILQGASRLPGLRLIAAWPMRLMMLQLAIIYCATGLLKSGNTWADGTALYYALNLDHFYRWPQTGVVTFFHWIGVLPITSVLVHFWEILFPVALIGVVLNRYERDRASGAWGKPALWRVALGWAFFLAAWCIGAWVAGVGAYYYLPDKALAVVKVSREQILDVTMIAVAALPLVFAGLYFALRRFLPRVHRFIRLWLLGKRTWLVIGFGMHIGIDVGMNVGTFAEVMMAVYFAWLTGAEVDSAWAFILSRPASPGEAGRPVRKKKALRLALAPVDRLFYRVPGRSYTVLHHPDEPSVRRAAILRLWDLGHRLDFHADEDVPPGQLWLRIEGDKTALRGAEAAGALTKIFPGLWWARPFRMIPGIGGLVGTLALKILRQKG
jgi:hypothetical protein